MSTSNPPTQTEDLISNVLDILHDKILELLPIRDAARTSVLSTQWRCNWLSLKRLVFDSAFFYERRRDLRECSSNIINSILLHHNGPVHEFTLKIPYGTNESFMNLSQWLSFLSRNEVRCITIVNGMSRMPISSYIFWCSELIYLELDNNLTLHPPPSGFNGFPKLERLLLVRIKFSQEDVFPCLIAKCRKLAMLKLQNCSGMGRHIVIDIPSLDTLFIRSELELEFESVAFKDVCNLKNITVRTPSMLGKPLAVETIDTFNYMASLRQLQCIDFYGGFCKIISAAGINRPLHVAFNHLNKLSLSCLDWSSIGLQDIFDMVKSCPYLKVLDITIYSSDDAIHHKSDYTQIHKSPHLLEVRVTGIMTGSRLGIQLIEYLLTTSVVLERLIYTTLNMKTESQLKLSRELSEIPRASPKARVIYSR